MQWTVDILSEIAHGSLDILMLINLLFISTNAFFQIMVEIKIEHHDSTKYIPIKAWNAELFHVSLIIWLQKDVVFVWFPNCWLRSVSFRENMSCMIKASHYLISDFSFLVFMFWETIGWIFNTHSIYQIYLHERRIILII